jgi:hypothetical protein
VESAVPEPKLISIWQIRHKIHGTIYTPIGPGELTSHFESREAAEA